MKWTRAIADIGTKDGYDSIAFEFSEDYFIGMTGMTRDNTNNDSRMKCTFKKSDDTSILCTTIERA